jgi:hypothetical protein
MFDVENLRSGKHFQVRFDPYGSDGPVRENLTSLTAVIASTIVGARAYMDGVLELRLDNGFVITVNPMEKFESWTYTFGNFILACPPGGFR